MISPTTFYAAACDVCGEILMGDFDTLLAATAAGMVALAVGEADEIGWTVEASEDGSSAYIVCAADDRDHRAARTGGRPDPAPQPGEGQVALDITGT